MSGQTRKVVVLGGGISGLSFSYYLNMFKKQVLTLPNAVLPQITILEKDGHVGGWMSSHIDSTTGAVFEQGPRSLRAVGHEARSSLSLAEDLGLTDKILHVKRTDPPGKVRLIYADNALHALPNSPMHIIHKFKPVNKSLLSMIIREIRTPASPEHQGKDESIYSFISRRFGVEAAERLADPFIRGIIAGDIRTTSVTAMLPYVKAADDEFGGVIRHMRKVKRQVHGAVKNSALCDRATKEKWAMWNFESGLNTLPTAIKDNLIETGVDIRTNTACNRLEKTEHGFLVHTDTEALEADYVVSCINADSLARLLPPEYNPIADKLSSLPAVHVATATLEYPRLSPEKLPQAFGHLIPSGEKEKNLGVIYDSVVFPQHDREDNSTTRLTAMIGGAWFDEVFGGNPTVSDVEDIAVSSIAKQLGISEKPVNIHSNILMNAIPQYPVGHGEMINDITSDVDKAALPLMLLGPSYHNPGANHCLHRAKVAAQLMLGDWDEKDYLSSHKSQAATESISEG